MQSRFLSIFIRQLCAASVVFSFYFSESHLKAMAALIACNSFPLWYLPSVSCLHFQIVRRKKNGDHHTTVSFHRYCIHHFWAIAIYFIFFFVGFALIFFCFAFAFAFQFGHALAMLWFNFIWYERASICRISSFRLVVSFIHCWAVSSSTTTNELCTFFFRFNL